MGPRSNNAELGVLNAGSIVGGCISGSNNFLINLTLNDVFKQLETFMTDTNNETKDKCADNMQEVLRNISQALIIQAEASKMEAQAKMKDAEARNKEAEVSLIRAEASRADKNIIKQISAILDKMFEKITNQ